MCSTSIIGSGNTAISVCTVGSRPPGGPMTPQMKCSLDTRTKIVPYTIIFKLIPKFKLLHKSEVTVAQGTLLQAFHFHLLLYTYYLVLSMKNKDTVPGSGCVHRCHTRPAEGCHCGRYRGQPVSAGDMERTWRQSW